MTNPSQFLSFTNAVVKSSRRRWVKSLMSRENLSTAQRQLTATQIVRQRILLNIAFFFRLPFVSLKVVQTKLIN